MSDLVFLPEGGLRAYWPVRKHDRRFNHAISVGYILLDVQDAIYKTGKSAIILARVGAPGETMHLACDVEIGRDNSSVFRCTIGEGNIEFDHYLSGPWEPLLDHWYHLVRSQRLKLLAPPTPDRVRGLHIEDAQADGHRG